jgi:hypothetical protein
VRRRSRSRLARLGATLAAVVALAGAIRAEEPSPPVAVLVTRLASTDLLERREAALALGRRESSDRAEAVPALVEALADPGMRRLAAKVLERIGGPQAERALAPYEEEVRRLLEARARDALRALAGPPAALAPHVHDAKGVRFSPYPYVEPEQHRHFSRDDLAVLSPSELLDWGQEDASDERIRLSWSDYRARFVLDRDYAASACVDFNPADKLGGAMQDNAFEVHPDALMVQFRATGPDESCDSASVALRLVFEAEGDAWRLVAVIHEGWTI